MFLRRHRKEAGGETYEYWTLVRTVRTAKGPRHETVAHLGKIDEPTAESARGWTDLEALLEGRTPTQQLELGKAVPPPPQPMLRRVDLSGVRVERMRQFGRVYLGLALWRRLGLHLLLQKQMPRGEEDIPWDPIGCVLSLGRFCAQTSELSVAERWYEDTALEDLLGIPLDKINETRLYRGLDELLPQKDALCLHLLERYRDWFGVKFEFLLYDVTSTFFEGLAKKNEKAAHGYKLVWVGEGDKTERFILCRSQDRAAKEGAMLQQKRARLRAELDKIDAGLKRRRAKVGEVERRIGRWLGKYPAAAAMLTVTLDKDGRGRARGLKIQEQTQRLEWAQQAYGAYLLRTNHPSSDAVELWRWYIQLIHAEAAFRTSKSDLKLRPLFHQKTPRVEAHILVCFLALAMWRSLEQWMRSKGLGDCGRQLLHELDELRSMDVILPTEKSEIRLRVVGKPEKPLAQLLSHLGLDLPRRPRILENVVQKIASEKLQPIANQAKPSAD